MSSTAALPAAVDRRFEAVLFDWDGTAVRDRAEDAGAVREAVLEGCEAGLDLAVVSGTHVGNIDGQLAARPEGPGELLMLLNRGSEVFRAGPGGVELVQRRVASEEEEAALDRAAELAVQRLAELGLEARIVSQRLNRRKIDIIPLPEWADPPKARIGDLLEAVEARLRGLGIEGLAAAVEIGEEAAAAAGLAAARVTSDVKHVEIGLTDKADSAGWYFEHLWRRGIAPEQVLIAGDELGPLGGLPGSDSRLLIREAAGATTVSVGVEPAGVPAGVSAIGGGPAMFLNLLERQLRARREGELPAVCSRPGWSMRIDGLDPAHERARESLLTLADGRLGTRGSLLAPRPASTPAVVLSGVYSGRGQQADLQAAPLWNVLDTGDVSGGLRRTLDLHAGLLRQEAPGGVRALLFSSLAQPGLAVMWAIGPERALEQSRALVVPPDVRAELDNDSGVVRLDVTDGTLEVAAAQRLAGRDGRASLERVAAYVATSAEDSSRPALRRVRSAGAAGRERLLAEHRGAWAERWEVSDVRIDGDPELQVAVRLALYHLIGSAADSGEAAVGARGLTGHGYRGHVFWDSDVFVLPFLAATHPPAARSILEYRLRRLPAAREAARALGLDGARFAWESARTGMDVTPQAAIDQGGREVAIHTGRREEHIVADVAWACACYLDWSGDEAFRRGPGLQLLVETARYWASRIERDGDGTAHIRGVIGPDEYHELVDDNAYTNVMARWNLRRAHRETSDADVEPRERAAWVELADALVDGHDPASGLYEQFAGFFELEPLIIAELAPRRPIAADLLISHERIERAQVVKQADVLMLHHLVPGELEPGSLEPNLGFYEPRTAHASSLSPGVHASLFARTGQLDDACRALALTARIDLDDISQSTSGGVHLASMGSLWQALAWGFAGARACERWLELDPRLPPQWELFELRLSYRDANVRVRVDREALQVSAERPTTVRIGGGEPLTVGPDGVRVER